MRGNLPRGSRFIAAFTSSDTFGAGSFFDAPLEPPFCAETEPLTKPGGEIPIKAYKRNAPTVILIRTALCLIRVSRVVAFVSTVPKDRTFDASLIVGFFVLRVSP
jgi:hypothetical protein